MSTIFGIDPVEKNNIRWHRQILMKINILEVKSGNKIWMAAYILIESLSHDWNVEAETLIMNGL